MFFAQAICLVESIIPQVICSSELACAYQGLLHLRFVYLGHFPEVNIFIITVKAGQTRSALEVHVISTNINVEILVSLTYSSGNLSLDFVNHIRSH